MTDEIAIPDLVKIIRETLGRESLRAVIKQTRQHQFHAVADHLNLVISARNYDVEIQAFEPDTLKTLELAISPALMVRIVKEYAEELRREGVSLPEEFLQALARAYGAASEAKKRQAELE